MKQVATLMIMKEVFFAPSLYIIYAISITMSLIVRIYPNPNPNLTLVKLSALDFFSIATNFN